MPDSSLPISPLVRQTRISAIAMATACSLWWLSGWLAGRPASWVGGLVGGGGSVFPESFGAEERQDGPD